MDASLLHPIHQELFENVKAALPASVFAQVYQVWLALADVPVEEWENVNFD